MDDFFQHSDVLLQAVQLAMLAAIGIFVFLQFKRWQWTRREELVHEEIDASIRRDRQNATIYWTKAERYESSGHYEEALLYYRMAHQLCPTAYNRSEYGVTQRRILAHLGKKPS